MNWAKLATGLVGSKLGHKAVAMKWVGREKEVAADINRKMSVRVKLAAQVLRDQVVKNISIPVERAGPGRGSKGRVVRRSTYGEYPRADTTRLMKDIFWQMDGETDAIVGTTLDYGAVLELSNRLDRSYLRRSLRENYGKIRSILLQPM